MENYVFITSVKLNFFFVEIGIHAREWIAHAVCTYMIDWLVNGDGNDILDKLNFHILPMANPDGYEYSHDTVSFLVTNEKKKCKLQFFCVPCRIVCGEKIVDITQVGVTELT